MNIESPNVRHSRLGVVNVHNIKTMMHLDFIPKSSINRSGLTYVFNLRNLEIFLILFLVSLLC